MQPLHFTETNRFSHGNCSDISGPLSFYSTVKTGPVAPPQVRAEMLNRTGVGIEGNGGVENSRVRQEVLKGSHQLPLERVGDTASVLGPWIGQSAQSWKEDEDRLAER
ncbi:uncharacterized protein N7469_003827 [Penicillium citrinum]|uniref:Uncharacterized protein n=1 Tax=Penicillium citrinum TaxID=5077 RepID=A0A9W9P3E7_PENCI|nr:uncharacterized protein N7469_003827 [Penicillium citrinum]KAJ5234659.1 hypothetical protein N7469_003827 [Penicillium citrinum]